MTEAAASITEDEVLNDEQGMRDAMRKLLTTFAPATPKKAERKAREKKARSVVDGRSLRAKGRTEQLNVKVRPDIKQALAVQIEAEGVTIADFMERMLEAALGMRGN
jgi:hypothetical protein